jgi:NTE family protein
MKGCEDKHEPIRKAPDQGNGKSPEPGIGICLSGGGFRAMLFHVGALWRLNEVGLLTKAARISSVSGGSITAAWLGLLWAQRRWGTAPIPADEFREYFAGGLCRLASRTLDIPSVLRGFLPWSNVGMEVSRVYDCELFCCATLQDLPDTPRFVFNASNLQSGALWRFSKPYMGDYKVGRVYKPITPLALAATASSAFPPFLSPLEMRLRPDQYTLTGDETLNYEPFNTCPTLTDGGVYDNLGLEPVFKRYTTVLVSDGGGPFRTEEKPVAMWPWQLKRVLDCIDNQVRSLRKRELMDAFNFGQRTGSYWGIGTPLDRYPKAISLKCSPQTSARLALIPTRLARMDEQMQRELINWGYAACEASLTSHYPHQGPEPAWPYPSCSLV